MDLLGKYLKKLGVKEFAELNEEEKATYRIWEETLSGRRLTDEEISEFFIVQEEDTVKKLIGTKNNEREDIFLKVKLEFIRNVRSFLDIPKFEKKIAEENISKFIES
jgi:hypothetical protein